MSVEGDSRHEFADEVIRNDYEKMHLLVTVAEIAMILFGVCFILFSVCGNCEHSLW